MSIANQLLAARGGDASRTGMVVGVDEARYHHHAFGVVDLGLLLVFPSGSGVAVAEGDPRPGGQALNRLDEIELVHLPHEGDDVPRLPAAAARC